MEQNRIPSVVPEQLAAVSESFVEFIKAYYVFMNTEDMPSYMLNNAVATRDVHAAVDTYLDVLYKEYGSGWVENKNGNRATIISNLNSIYKSRGSIDSIKILFRILFGEEVTVTLPKEFILKPSTGSWVQDYSVIVSLDDGDIDKIVGEFITVTTFFPGAPEQSFEVEIKRVNVRDQTAGIYEIFISRYYAGFFFQGSKLKFQDVEMSLIESLSDTVDITKAGTNFKLGESYDIPHYVYNYSLIYINALSEPARTNYLSAVGGLYELKEFERWYVSTDEKNPRKIETVSEQHFTNGSSVSTVSRENITSLVILRGKRETSKTRSVDGTTTTKNKNKPSNLVATDITVNYDAIIERMIDYVEYSGGDYLSTFFAEIPAGESFARGDINNDGVIDINDVILLARRSMGYTVSIAEQVWVDSFIGQAVLEQGLNGDFLTGSGDGASIRVIGTDDTNGVSLLRLVSFGYNYPQVYSTFISPNESGEATELSFISTPVGVTAADYKDRKGFLSDIIKIQDNNFYQDFSYTVQSSQNPTVSNDLITRTVHPAGMKLFAEQVIVSDFSLAELNQSTEYYSARAMIVINVFAHLAYELMSVSEAVSIRPLKGFIESLAISDQDPLKVINLIKSESLSVSDPQAKYFDKDSFTESLGVDEDLFKNPKANQTESMSASDSAILDLDTLYVESGYFESDYAYVKFLGPTTIA